MTQPITNFIENANYRKLFDSDYEGVELELEELGYDINQIKQLSNEIHKRQSFLLMGYANRVKDEGLIARASKLLHEGLIKREEKPISYLKSILENKKMVAQYRSLESLSKEQINEIIKDINLVELLEKLEDDLK